MHRNTRPLCLAATAGTELVRANKIIDHYSNNPIGYLRPVIPSIPPQNVARLRFSLVAHDSLSKVSNETRTRISVPMWLCVRSKPATDAPRSAIT